MKNCAKTFSRPALEIGALLVGAAVLASAAPARAEQIGNNPQPATPGATSDLAPPTPTAPQKVTTNYMALLEAVVLAALVVGVNFIPSKRGHQD